MYIQTAEIESNLPKPYALPQQETGSPLVTILLVEDEAFVRQVTSEVLQAAGYRVLEATNAGEAMLIYERYCGSVDLLLTDVILPGGNGRGLAQKLQQRNPSLQVLLVTGYGDQVSREPNAAQCLPKPFSSAALLQRIGQMLKEAN